MRISDWSSDVCSSDLGAHYGSGVGGRVGGNAGGRTDRAVADPAREAASLASSRGRTRVVGAVLDQGEVLVALQLLGLLHGLVIDFLVATGLVNDVLGARNHEVLAGNLAVVAKAGRRGDGHEAGIVAFDLRVVGRRGEAVGVTFQDEIGRAHV